MARPRPNRITAHIHAAVERIDSICGRARNDIRARLLEHIDEHPYSPWSYANVARLERTLTEMYQQWGSSVNAVFDDFLPQEYQAGYERAKADLTRSGVWQNITGGPDLRRIRNALDSVYNNVALRTDKMSFDHIRQLRNFSAKVFRESAITGETRRQVSDRLENEALQVPGFQFTDIAGHRWSHQSYFEMLARTELMNGARDSYEQQCAAEGYNIMLLSVSGHCCEACAKYEGQYFSIGPNKYGLPTKDDLEAAGVFHPNCTHSYSAVPDYIIEKEFGKTEKGSSPKSPASPSKLDKIENTDYAKNNGKNIIHSKLPVASKAAIEFTQTNIADKVDTTGLSTDAVDAINTHMFAAMQKYGLGKLPDFAPTTDPRGILGIDRESGIFVFNAEIWNEIVNNPRAAFVRFVKKPEKFAGRKLYAIDNPRQVVKHMIDHESGHRLYNRSKLPDKEERLEELWKQHRDDKMFGSYAASNPREFFSEAFAIRERGGILSSDISAFIDEVVK